MKKIIIVLCILLMAVAAYAIPNYARPSSKDKIDAAVMNGSGYFYFVKGNSADRTVQEVLVVYKNANINIPAINGLLTQRLGYTVKFQKIATMRTLEDAIANVSDRLKQQGGGKEPVPKESYTPPLKNTR